jgi:hypothetical protein
MRLRARRRASSSDRVGRLSSIGFRREEGDRLLVCTSDWPWKAKDMRRNPRVGLSVVDLINPYRMAGLQSRVIEERPDEKGGDFVFDPPYARGPVRLVLPAEHFLPADCIGIVRVVDSADNAEMTRRMLPEHPGILTEHKDAGGHHVRS